MRLGDSELIEIRRQRLAVGRGEPMEELAAHVMPIVDKAAEKHSKRTDKKLRATLLKMIGGASVTAGLQTVLRLERTSEATMVAGLEELASFAASTSHDSELGFGPILEPNPLGCLVGRRSPTSRRPRLPAPSSWRRCAATRTPSSSWLVRWPASRREPSGDRRPSASCSGRSRR